MNKCINILGLVLVMIGTIFSLWSVLGTRSDIVQTAGYQDHLQENFKKDKKKVVLGTILIILGTLFQIIGVFIS